MFRLSDGEEIMTLAFFVLIQYRSVMDRQTDGHSSSGYTSGLHSLQLAGKKAFERSRLQLIRPHEVDYKSYGVLPCMLYKMHFTQNCSSKKSPKIIQKKLQLLTYELYVNDFFSTVFFFCRLYGIIYRKRKRLKKSHSQFFL